MMTRLRRYPEREPQISRVESLVRLLMLLSVERTGRPMWGSLDRGSPTGFAVLEVV